MSIIVRVFAGLCLLVAFAVAAPAQTPNAKKSTGGGSATIHFLRPAGLIVMPWKVNVSIDGRVVGKIADGEYFTVNRPAGKRTLFASGGALDGGFTSEVTLEAGKTYYIGVVRHTRYQPIGYQAMSAILSGSAGKPMAGSGFMAGAEFTMLSPEEGRAEIAKIKDRGKKTETGAKTE